MGTGPAHGFHSRCSSPCWHGEARGTMGSLFWGAAVGAAGEGRSWAHPTQPCRCRPVRGSGSDSSCNASAVCNIPMLGPSGCPAPGVRCCSPASLGDCAPPLHRLDEKTELGFGQDRCRSRVPAAVPAGRWHLPQPRPGRDRSPPAFVPPRDGKKFVFPEFNTLRPAPCPSAARSRLGTRLPGRQRHGDSALRGQGRRTGRGGHSAGAGTRTADGGRRGDARAGRPTQAAPSASRRSAVRPERAGPFRCHPRFGARFLAAGAERRKRQDGGQGARRLAERQWEGEAVPRGGPRPGSPFRRRGV